MENEMPKKEEVVAKQSEVVSLDKPENQSVRQASKPRKSKMSTNAWLIFLFVAAIVLLGTYIISNKKGWFVAAVVNGTPISRLSIVEELEKRGGKDVLDAMITKKLLADKTKSLQIVIKNEDIAAEIKKVEDQMVAQGSSLDAALLQQNMTRQDLTDQILINKQLEQILADKVKVTEEDIDQYLKDNKSAPPKGANVADFRERIRQQLESQKFSTEAQAFVESLRAEATIERYVGY